jgi:hypothetical protein
MSSEHPHPLRCHPLSPQYSSLTNGIVLANGNGYHHEDGPLDEEFSLVSSRAASPSKTTEMEDGFADGASLTSPLIAITPPASDGLSFVDLFGKDGLNGRRTDQIADIVQRVFDFVSSILLEIFLVSVN